MELRSSSEGFLDFLIQLASKVGIVTNLSNKLSVSTGFVLAIKMEHHKILAVKTVITFIVFVEMICRN